MSPHLLPDIGSDPRRLVRLDAVHNFRDLGGFPTTTGRTTKWRTLYRADGLYRLKGDDLAVVTELGLRTVIDLRTPTELEERGRFPVDQHPVDFHHVSIIERPWKPEDIGPTDDTADFLEAAYVRMLEDGLTKFPRAIKSLCRPGALPAVFHCAAGKDRTGMMAMLVLGAIEVVDEYIVADYALTAEGMARFNTWAVANFPDAYERMNSMPPAFGASVPEAMMRMLGRMRREHGSVTNYVLELGVTQGEVDHLREHLLD
jgi:protein-tyrosine phosphatase